MIRLAGESDLCFLAAHDRHIDAQELARVVCAGRVYIAIDAPGFSFCRELHLSGSRAEIRRQAAEAVLQMILELM